MANTFGTQGTLKIDAQEYTVHRLAPLYQKYPQAERLPYSLKILLECLLRTEDGVAVLPQDITNLAQWDAQATPSREIAFTPSRVLLQDFTGVPAIVDLSAMRDAMKKMGGDPRRINPLQPVELVIDHSVQVDMFGTPQAFQGNSDLEYSRNRERYVFLRWGQSAFRNFRVVPPETGIVHQVNLEYLARVAFSNPETQPLPTLYPDTLVGTDSHTTMINGLGVLGWGVGGIEAEAAMLGQPVSMLIPQVLGFKLHGQLREGATATDLVLTVTQILRKRGVVGMFVEFFGQGLDALPLADRATIANMAPEYGATCGIFPVDDVTLAYLRLTGRQPEQVRRVEAYYKEQGLFRTTSAPEPIFSAVLELDLATVVPSLAGPKRPQDRVPLGEVAKSFFTALPDLQVKKKSAVSGVELGKVSSHAGHPAGSLPPQHGMVVIAAITSCTNTSNPSVMLAAGLVAKKAVERGLETKPWVKTSLAPGSKVVTEYFSEAGLTRYLEQLRFNLVGYGCTTCIGNSGPLPPEISATIAEHDLVAVSVLSGNRNFEGRVHPEVRANYLASPPLVVAYALAGRIDFDFENEPLGDDQEGNHVYLRDLWPTQKEVMETVRQSVRPEMFSETYKDVFNGDEHWRHLDVPTGDLFDWRPNSTYVKNPPYFDDMPAVPAPVRDIKGARVLALLGDSITTDHISPAGSIKKDGPAGKYLMAHHVAPAEFNSYGSRRGNHEVMVRGTFANVRLRNCLAPGTEGGFTRYLPDGEEMTIFDASEKYRAAGVPLVILAGKEYGSGSSRDWAAKGPLLLGVRVVIADSYERIHRSNLVGMGILPLQFRPGQNAETHGLSGEEVYDLEGLPDAIGKEFNTTRMVKVHAHRADGTTKTFEAHVRIDTPQEVRYYEHGGILQYVLRQMLARK
jgi:aconitate hydratase